MDEATPPGESEPVAKAAAGRERVFMMGTTLLTGPRTELGRIAASLKEHVEEDTPLQVRLKAFSRILTFIVIAFTAVIFLAGLLTGRGFLEMLRTSVILAISAVSEGLLIAATVILVLGMRKILKRGGLVKKLLAVEIGKAITNRVRDRRKAASRIK